MNCSEHTGWISACVLLLHQLNVFADQYLILAPSTISSLYWVSLVVIAPGVCLVLLRQHIDHSNIMSIFSAKPPPFLRGVIYVLFFCTTRRFFCFVAEVCTCSGTFPSSSIPELGPRSYAKKISARLYYYKIGDYLH